MFRHPNHHDILKRTVYAIVTEDYVTIASSVNLKAREKALRSQGKAEGLHTPFEVVPLTIALCDGFELDAYKYAYCMLASDAGEKVRMGHRSLFRPHDFTPHDDTQRIMDRSFWPAMDIEKARERLRAMNQAPDPQTDRTTRSEPEAQRLSDPDTLANPITDRPARAVSAWAWVLAGAALAGFMFTRLRKA